MEIRFLLPAEGEAEGKTVWTTCRTSTVPWRGGRAVLVNMVDTTRAKELEQIVLAREKMASLGQMAGSIAHEIRNPLSGVNIYLAAIGEILAKPGAVAGPTAGELEGALAGIRTASEKMEDVIGRVMKFLKPGPARNEEADINAAIGEAIHGAQLLLRRQGVILTQTLTPELPLCRGDRKLLEQVMLNLITNAVQAMAGKAGKKSIEIASCRDGDLLYVSVGDSGPGVPPALRKKIFDPFFTTRSDGTGIGLAFSHRVVTDHGGSISVGDGPLGGAEFRLKLPLAGGAATGNKELPGK